MSDKADDVLTSRSKALNIPEDVLAAICRLESKRIWRESWEARIDRADEALDREKEQK
jgi:hypothetical protein